MSNLPYYLECIIERAFTVDPVRTESDVIQLLNSADGFPYEEELRWLITRLRSGSPEAVTAPPVQFSKAQSRN